MNALNLWKNREKNASFHESRLSCFDFTFFFLYFIPSRLLDAIVCYAPQAIRITIFVCCVRLSIFCFGRWELVPALNRMKFKSLLNSIAVGWDGIREVSWKNCFCLPLLTCDLCGTTEWNMMMFETWDKHQDIFGKGDPKLWTILLGD